MNKTFMKLMITLALVISLASNALTSEERMHNAVTSKPCADEEVVHDAVKIIFAKIQRPDIEYSLKDCAIYFNAIDEYHGVALKMNQIVCPIMFTINQTGHSVEIEDLDSTVEELKQCLAANEIKKDSKKLDEKESETVASNSTDIEEELVEPVEEVNTQEGINSTISGNISSETEEIEFSATKLPVLNEEDKNLGTNDKECIDDDKNEIKTTIISEMEKLDGSKNYDVDINDCRKDVVGSSKLFKLQTKVNEVECDYILISENLNNSKIAFDSNKENHFKNQIQTCFDIIKENEEKEKRREKNKKNNDKKKAKKLLEKLKNSVSSESTVEPEDLISTSNEKIIDINNNNSTINLNTEEEKKIMVENLKFENEKLAENPVQEEKNIIALFEDIDEPAKENLDQNEKKIEPTPLDTNVNTVIESHENIETPIKKDSPKNSYSMCSEPEFKIARSDFYEKHEEIQIKAPSQIEFRMCMNDSNISENYIKRVLFIKINGTDCNIKVITEKSEINSEEYKTYFDNFKKEIHECYTKANFIYETIEEEIYTRENVIVPNQLELEKEISEEQNDELVNNTDEVIGTTSQHETTNESYNEIITNSGSNLEDIKVNAEIHSSSDNKPVEQLENYHLNHENEHHNKINKALKTDEWTIATQLYSELTIANILNGKHVYKQNVESLDIIDGETIEYDVHLKFNNERCLLIVSRDSENKLSVYPGTIENNEKDNLSLIHVDQALKVKNCFELYGTEWAKADMVSL